MDPIFNFIAEDVVPDDEKKAEKTCRTVARYWLSANRKLYRRSLTGLTCSACILARLRNYLLSYMKGCVAVT